MPKLYVVATPIGNLSDASPRMLETLQAAQLVVAEDTRVTGNLLRHFDISKPLTSLHRHNEEGKADSLVQRMLEENMDVALVTDAGTPAVSDPGFLFVRKAVEAGIEAIAIAGPSAVAAAISVSGIDAREFTFHGFLPREKGDLRKKLEVIAKEARVAVAYESPYRVIHLVETIAETLPGCHISLSCDLTKLYEKTLYGKAEDVLAALRANPKAEKGEYCIVVDAASAALPEEEPIPETSLEARLFDLLFKGQSMKDAINTLVEGGARKNEAKRAALAVRAFIEEGQLE